ncbi:MAG TPA: alpha-galactosidase [Candidatus Lokiarchaeia archaeon]|nr:alpha-galactosidase [Candidatus Lokiarchaeia archaeon]
MPPSSDINIENQQISITFLPGDDKYSVSFRDDLFKIDGMLGTSQQSASIVDVDDQMGSGTAIKLVLLDDNTDYIMLHPGFPFICVKREFSNPTNLPVTASDAVTARFRLAFDTPVSELRVLSCDGLMPAFTDRTCYTFLAITKPAQRCGIVAGWLSQEVGSGIVLMQNKKDDVLEITARCEFGKLLLGSGEVRQGDTFMIGYFDDCIAGLEEYASAIARYYRIELPPFRGGYCTWYAVRNYGASDEKSMAKLAAFCNKNLVNFGFDVLQIDDRWQAGPRRKITNLGPRGDFSMHDPRGPYPSGMKAIASKITALGMTAGLWLMPFAWDPDSDAMKVHHDWYAKKNDGSIYEVRWAGWCLDMTNPEAKKHVATTIDRMTREWGFKYLKMDAMWTGLAIKLVYTPEPVYTPDELGETVFHDPAMTNVQAYRAGLAAIQQAAAPGTFLQGCTIAQNMRTLGAAMGLLHAMRIGRDIKAKWAPIVDDARMGGRLFFLNARVWYNDPDCLMLRKPLSLNQARAWGSWIAVSGQLNIVSENLSRLPSNRLDVVKRTMPMTGLCGRPLDLFDNDPARVWHLADTRGGIHARRDIVALFNWDKKQDMDITVDLARLGLQDDMTDGFIAFSFWDNTVLVISGKTFSTRVPSASCMVLALRPRTSHPQVISTSRHVTQGIVDLTNESWQDGVLSGTSDIVGGDPYELRVDAPTDCNAKSARATVLSSGESLGVKLKQVENLVTVQVQAPINCTIDWQIEFT